ncbi:MAG: ABC-F family ATP-binding cassette domain-containing protein [Bacteroidetes bacterium]|nr:ABC-F family ATP-binding cassette domain-containing protein [Bacteroidota bacterium]
MVSVQNLSMHYSGDDLFTRISFMIRPKDRIGLVGKNGAGKTTLLRLMCGIEVPRGGEIVIPEETTIGYLPQEKEHNSQQTVLKEAFLAFDEINRLEQQIAQTGTLLASRDDYESAAYHRLIEKLAVLNERFAMIGGQSLEGEAEKVLLGLGFERSDFSRPMAEFSNGWQMRVELAKLLLKKPSLLLLDEPTNHLDIESIQWLEQFLQGYYGAIIMVSHDRAFLDNVCNRTIEISQARIYDYKGSYSDYVSNREQRVESQVAAYNNQQREIREIERFIERFRYKSTKAKQVQSRVKLLEKMDEVIVDDRDQSSIHFRFPPAPHSGKIVVEAKKVTKHYGALEVLNSIDLTILRGEKIAFVGRNGEGKSTLSKIIARLLEHEGELKLGHLVSMGYYAQNQGDMLDPEQTVFETLDEIAIGDMRTKVKSLLGAFLFSGETIDKKVKVLSGGEKSRLSLAKLLLKPTNLLVLDEPTNHLDMQSKDILKSALLRFDGTLIVVSHDRDFLQGLTTKVYEFRKPVIREFIGDIYDFLEARAIEKLDELNLARPKQVESSDSQPSVNKTNYAQRKLIDKELRKTDKEIESIENNIQQLELQLETMNEVLKNPAAYAGNTIDDAWYKQYNGIKQEIQQLMENWDEKHREKDELTSKLAQFQ